MLINIFENLIFLHKLNKGKSTRRIMHCQEQLEILRGPPRKNQTKMIFFRQGSKIEILSIFAYK